jgi:hypothetical protein
VLSAHTAQALGSGPVSASITNAVFISNSYSSETERELTIANIAKAAFDYWAVHN